jgi:type IV secretory pathway TrbF-like protein
LKAVFQTKTRQNIRLNPIGIFITGTW